MFTRDQIEAKRLDAAKHRIEATSEGFEPYEGGYWAGYEAALRSLLQIEEFRGEAAKERSTVHG